jgi:predicted helicase
LETFTALCREVINPNLAPQAVEEMLIQHLLTERLFRTVFHNPDFIERNVIAREIEKVIQALTATHFSRDEFLKPLDRFYGAIEKAATTLHDYTHKQTFLNAVYEQFFQGFSVKVADTHGIVYTPQPIVDFMVRSIEGILQQEFGRSLSSKGVHILDPFVGTGNFIARIMREIKKTSLEYKYKNEIHCNEVMLLPYYIASMNIEHEYYDLTGSYEPFEGICLVDTFELAEGKQISLFIMENTQRVNRQKLSPIFVIIGNPPYNARQIDENDNNKNRRYPTLDKKIAETYIKDSMATLVNQLSDPYVKAIRFASERVGDEGIVAFITNNGFIDSIAFDGMRKHLSKDFSIIYILDLGGNIRRNPKLSGTTHNVFGIQVGVSINLFVKKNNNQEPKILYSRLDEFWRKEQKYNFLNQKVNIDKIEWKEIHPDCRHNWLTEGIQASFENFLPIGDKRNKRASKSQAIFQSFSNGIKTNNDAYVYNHQEMYPVSIAKNMVTIFNEEYYRWIAKGRPKFIDEFLNIDTKSMKWIRNTKRSLTRGIRAIFDETKIRKCLYRPFCKQFYYFERIFNEDTHQFPHIFPTPESKNYLICVSGIGHDIFICLISRCIVDLKYSNSSNGATQCFPFYTYADDGSNRRENITDWTLEQFMAHYTDTHISKWDIFHYVYAVLHHPQYRETYAANLKRELPRIPFIPDFWAFVGVGKQLAQIHVHYEDEEAYPLDMIETPGKPLNWRVEKIRLSKDKTQLVYNDFLTLAGIPPETFAYRLGNRSALDWIIDQYQVKTDKRSGIVNDPNRSDDPQYIVRLIGQVITVSLKTIQLIAQLPTLDIANHELGIDPKFDVKPSSVINPIL